MTDTGERRRHTDQEWPSIGCTFCGALRGEPHRQEPDGTPCRMGQPCAHEYEREVATEVCAKCGVRRTVTIAGDQ